LLDRFPLQILWRAFSSTISVIRSMPQGHRLHCS
jgi:hypothetical protein